MSEGARLSSAAEPIYVPGAVAIPDASVIGGKARGLARLRELAASGGFDVPRFVVLTTDFQESSADIREDLRGAAEAALRGAGLSSARLAVRSSATVEDSASRSYAGLFASVLGVHVDNLWEAVRTVWASALDPRVVEYARAPGEDTTPRMAVILQEMVEPEVSGVAFSVDPVGARNDVAVVSAVLGLGEGLVSGQLDADSYWISADGAVESRIAAKSQAVRSAAGGGTEMVSLDERLTTEPALSEDEARQVAAAARALETALGSPQDIEWALVRRGSGRRLVLLQARPITTLPAERRVWDNSNIIESYPGVTSPLTFSFARAVYEEVYRQFCRLLGVPEPILESYRPVFASMLGHIRGRVYYDLLNWYRMLALLPGYHLNREFMERMMGVRERLENPPPPPAPGSRWAERLRLARTTILLLRAQAGLGRAVPAFLRRVDRALAPTERENPTAWPAERLIVEYRRLESELLHDWRVPIVNDFFAMVSFGVLCRTTEKWLPRHPASLVNDLLCGETGVRSTEPARRVMALARTVRQDDSLSRAFDENADDAALWRQLESSPAHASFLDRARAYLLEFGDRCVEELKLETVPPSAEPSQVLGVIRSYARAGLVDDQAGRERERQVRQAAERTVARDLRGLRRFVFDWVLVRARRRVRDRENLRFERTRVFGAVRRIFVGLGHRLFERGALDEPRDVFQLTVTEVFDFFEKGGRASEAKERARWRRREFEVYVREAPPPPRFESRGSTPPAAVATTGVAAPSGDGGGLQGIGCCPGVIRAPVRIVRDPAAPGDLTGRILVAERTDPGWTLLFPLARGLVVERGSLLSHSAIVAREIGLPCIVGVPGLLDALADGELVEMDGSAGVIRRLGVADGSV